MLLSSKSGDGDQAHVSLTQDKNSTEEKREHSPLLIIAGAEDEFVDL